MNTRILQVISIPSGNQDKNKSLVLLMVKRMMVRSMLWIWLAKHWCTSEWFLQITNTQMHKYTNAQIHKCTNSQMHKCTNTQIHKYTNAQIHKCTNTQMQRALQNGRGDVEAPPRGTLMWQVCDFVRWVGAWQVWPIGGNSFPRCWAFCVFVYFFFVYLCIICVLVYLTSGNCFQTWWTFTSSGTLRSC